MSKAPATSQSQGSKAVCRSDPGAFPSDIMEDLLPHSWSCTHLSAGGWGAGAGSPSVPHQPFPDPRLLDSPAQAVAELPQPIQNLAKGSQCLLCWCRSCSRWRFSVPSSQALIRLTVMSSGLRSRAQLVLTPYTRPPSSAPLIQRHLQFYSDP